VLRGTAQKSEPQPRAHERVVALALTRADGTTVVGYPCGCKVTDIPSTLREAVVCRLHALWPIDAQLIRYLPTALVVGLALA
jgi:hypothetical protein